MFDVIVVDEVHRAGSPSYQRIMAYFTPGFWLGMTASPERMDGFDIYSLFDHNIAFEIRLQQALEADLLCPFHYFGITELEIEGQVFDDSAGLRNFSNLICDVRVDYILEKACYFGYSGNRVKGLIFCSSIAEAGALSEKFNIRGYKTTFLSGDTAPEERDQCIEKLTTHSNTEYLDYIFTVDIFNEGVDIPEINQVILLRPTMSPVVFVQQLGRGLRKAENKEYVVILDFIGNYSNNYMIPIALSGDRSYNKDNMRKYVAGGTRIIPGNSSIHFDEISRKRIYTSIDTAKTNDLQLIKESYQKLKYKLGRIPGVQDFSKYGAIDITKIFDKFGSYYTFLVKYEKDYRVRLTKEQVCVVEYLSQKLTRGKRIHELVFLKHLAVQENRLMIYFKRLMQEKYNRKISWAEQNPVIFNLTNTFPKKQDREKYAACVFIEKDVKGDYRIAGQFQEILKDRIFSEVFFDLIEFGISRYNEKYSNCYKDTNLELYEKYTYEDVCRLLNWKQNINAQSIGGYFYDQYTKTLPVFINYEKSADAIAYKDRFISENELIAISKHPRKITSSDVKHIYKKGIEEKDNRVYLFMRKNKEDKEASKEFYFLGEINAVGEPKPILMSSTNDNAFEITYRLDTRLEKIYTNT